MKIAIVTSFQDFNESYSLSGIVKDQVRMFSKYGDEITLFVCERFNDAHLKWFEIFNVKVKKIIPFGHLFDYQAKEQLQPEHKELAIKTEMVLTEELKGFDIVIDHDLCFQGWHYPYQIGIVETSRKYLNIPFVHWIHSIPSGMKDIWDIKDMGRNNYLAYPNATDQLRIAEQYKGRISDVRIFPHIKDIRSFFDFHPDTVRFIDRYPAVMQHEIICILPASTDKLGSKGLNVTIPIMGWIKKAGYSVCLVAMNQFCTTTQPKQNIEPYKDMAVSEGLEIGKDFIFTSEFEPPDFEIGLHKRMVRELMQLSTIFIYATQCESFGLVIPEISLSSGALMVLNASLAPLREVISNYALWFDFGSHCQRHHIENKHDYYKQIAQIIMGSVLKNDALKAKIYFRMTNNFDYLYKRYYRPIFSELIHNHQEIRSKR